MHGHSAARPSVRALTLQLQNCRAQFLDRWKAARRLALAAGLIGIAAAAFALFPRWHNQAVSQSAAPANIPPKSIAVLPFRNLSEDKENAFFADGIQDDLVTSLARIKDLKVVSRSRRWEKMSITAVASFSISPSRQRGRARRS